jgi:soluble lytic murein transglycosylase-like protein
LACMLLLAPMSWAASFQGLSSEFDVYFKATSERFLKRDWRQLKAQGWQESRLRADAISHAGAMGVMQFMPGTWTMCGKALNISASPYNAKASIICGGWYMSRLDRNWNRRGRTPDEVWYLSLASYNAGIGNILKAQGKCDNSVYWEDIWPCLHLVTGIDNSLETTRYVIVIPQIYYRMKQITER